MPDTEAARYRTTVRYELSHKLILISGSDQEYSLIKYKCLSFFHLVKQVRLLEIRYAIQTGIQIYINKFEIVR